VSASELRIDAKSDRVRFPVHVQPRASRTGIAGLHGEALKIRVSAPAIEDAANAALVALLADLLGVARSAVQIVTGHHSRSKVVEVVGIDEESIRRLVSDAATR
jgi:uncharacterized protein (TIGR00251 family)